MMMGDMEVWTTVLLLVFPLLTLFLLKSTYYKNLFPSKSTKLPRSLPIFGSYFSLIKNRRRINNWMAGIVNSQPSSTFILRRPLGQRNVITANPAVVKHILKTNFNNYQKGSFSTAILRDFLGNGIFNVDGPTWKFQRQISSHQFNTNSLRHFVQTVVDTELSHRLIPILTTTAASIPNKTLDFQDILQRFTFDNICKIAFGYDPAYLLPSLPEAKFAVAFETAVMVSSSRFVSVTPLFWKIRRFFQIGAEMDLAQAIQIVREFATTVMNEKKQELKDKTELQSVDLLSRFLSSGHSDEVFVTDTVISFILAGRDTTSAALTWFFYLIAKHPKVEEEIVREIVKEQTTDLSAYDEVKEMVYTHAALCESMRLYPPVPSDGKEVMRDDVLPEGTVVRKGNRVIYHPYAMGRSEKLWGPDWAEFKPERWLEREEGSGKWVFVGRDQYAYPVFQAGPRVCLGKEMAFLQMKRVVAGVLRGFRVVPAMEEGKEPVYISYLTSKMEGGFPVTIQQRA